MLFRSAVVPLGLVPLTFAYAILRYKLWDIEVIVRDTISPCGCALAACVINEEMSSG